MTEKSGSRRLWFRIRNVGAGIREWLKLQRMRRIFPTLPERDRAIFGSVRFDNLSFADSAELHGCSVEEVQEVILRTLRALDA